MAGDVAFKFLKILGERKVGNRKKISQARSAGKYIRIGFTRC